MTHSRVFVGFVMASITACGGASDHDTDGGASDQDTVGGTSDAKIPITDGEQVEPPEAAVDGDLACLGDNAPPPPDSTSLSLVGWVRRLTDPEAKDGAPPARVKAYDESGVWLGSSFADTFDGRVHLTVPVRKEGFIGYVIATLDGYLDGHVYSSRPYTNTDSGGWIWLLTSEEVAERAKAVGITLDENNGVIVGAVHDCGGMGIENAIVSVGGATDILYFDAFDIASEATFTDASGRFAAPNVPAGPVVVQAYGRLEQGGSVVLLSRVTVQAVKGAIVAVDLQPRVGADQ